MDYPALLAELGRQYPPLSKHQFGVSLGSGPYYSEFYPPWESQNPTPGQPLIQLREKGQQLSPKSMKNLLLGETFHHLGARDPTGVPIDPSFRMLKELFMQNLTPQQLQRDRQSYLEQMTTGGETRSFQEWMDQSQADAYLRGYLSPINEAERLDWASTYTPHQRRILNQMKEYLGTGVLQP